MNLRVAFAGIGLATIALAGCKTTSNRTACPQPVVVQSAPFARPAQAPCCNGNPAVAPGVPGQPPVGAQVPPQPVPYGR
jgi:hypothetical protein